MKPTNRKGRMTRHLGLAATGFGVWGLLVLLFAAPVVLTGPVSWREAVRFGLSFWSPWLVFLPGVVWLAFRFPIERGTLVRNAGVHLFGCLLTVGASQAAFRTVNWISPSPHRPGSSHPRPPQSGKNVVSMDGHVGPVE